MSLLKEIEDKGAVLEWSPIQDRPNLVALGTKDSSGVGFDDYGGGIELHALDFADSKNTSSMLLGKAKASSRFASLAWSQMATNQAQFPYGLIAGGMMDGFINVWDPAKFILEQPPLIASVEQHQGSISGLHFNPHKESSHLLASGGNDGEVYIMSLEHPDNPNVFVPAPPPNNSKHTADITKVVWNTQVAHIVASSAQNGVCYVWDLRQKKAWCEIRDPTGGCVSDIAWNPDQGLHFVTASGEDKNPVIKLWDLRSSTSVPLATLQGHTEGVLSVSWCPHDPTFMLSCGKDNRTICWDLFHLQPVYDLPNDSSVIDHHLNPLQSPTKPCSNSNNNSTSQQSAMDAFGGGSANAGGVFGGSSVGAGGLGSGGLANTAGQKRYDIKWSPCLKSVVSTCSFDRKVHFFSLSGVQSRLKRAPKWLKKPTGLHFSFGGKLVSFDNKSGISGAMNVPLGQSNKSASTAVCVRNIVEDYALIESCEKFHAILTNSNYNNTASGTTAAAIDTTYQLKAYCEIKSHATDISPHDRKVWELMKVICFGANARAELIDYLGFKNDDIAKAVESYVKSKNPEYHSNSSRILNSSSNGSKIDNTASVATATVVPPQPESSLSSPFSFSSSAAAAVSAESVFGGSNTIGGFEALTLSLTPRSTSPNKNILDDSNHNVVNNSGIESLSAFDMPPPPSTETTISSSSSAATVTNKQTAAVTTASAVPLTKEEIETEQLIREAIVIGNFAAAVECCLQTNQMAEALILAQCGDQELWLKTQAIFFEKSKNKHAFISILQAIIKNDLINYVAQSDLNKWKETLAVCSTYGKSDEFPIMCEKLGYRLQTEIQNLKASALCYMCSTNISETISFWTQELKVLNQTTSTGHTNIHALQNYIEKVTVFSKANPSIQLSSDCLDFFAEYASLLAAQGKFEIALSYLKGNNDQEKILMDRLYSAASVSGTAPVAMKPPVFPFERITINPVVSNYVPTTTVATTIVNTPAAIVTNSATTQVPVTNTVTAIGTRGNIMTQQPVQQQSSIASVRPNPTTTTTNSLQRQHPSQLPTVATAATQQQQQLVPGWQQTIDPSSGRAYYFNQATGQSAWDPPMVTVTIPAPIVTSTPVPLASTQPSSSYPQQQQQPQAYQTMQPQSQSQQPSGMIPGMYGQQQPSSSMSNNNNYSQQQSQPQVMSTMSGRSTAAPMTTMSGGTTSNFNNPSMTMMMPSSSYTATAPVLPAPAPAPVVVKELLPDSEAVLLLNQVISAVTAAASPAEKRQMAMVNDAFHCLRQRASEGAVAPEIMNKVHQLAIDISVRNFPSASAIQADLANTAWTEHKDWVKGLKVFIQIASKK